MVPLTGYAGRGVFESYRRMGRQVRTSAPARPTVYVKGEVIAEAELSHGNVG